MSNYKEKEKKKMEKVKVIFDVKNAIHISKENKELKCLVCSIRCSIKGTNGEEVPDIVEEWKDFKQVALNESKEISLKDIQKTDNGLKIKGFSIPWNIQYFINQLIDKGYIHD